MTTKPEQIRSWRKSRQLTQSQAAELLGVPLRSFCRWELGVASPRSLAVKRLAEVMQQTQTK